jgi:hypothetical protein
MLTYSGDGSNVVLVSETRTQEDEMTATTQAAELAGDLNLAYDRRDYSVFNALVAVLPARYAAEARDLGLAYSNRDYRVFRAVTAFLATRNF